MKPGDVITCGNLACGAQARAASTNPAAWREGWPVVLAWPDGRTEATASKPDRCLSCQERGEALGRDTPPPKRPGPMRELGAAPASDVPPAPAPAGQLALL